MYCYVISDIIYYFLNQLDNLWWLAIFVLYRF